MTPFLDGVKILQPTVFATGSLDLVLEMAAAQYDAMEMNCTRLVGEHLIPGVRKRQSAKREMYFEG